MRLGAIEGGGTKFLCAVGAHHERMDALERFPTTTPDETLRRVVEFFRDHRVDALGIGTFGPVELREGPRWGSLLDTPKPGWKDVPLAGHLGEALGVPVAIDTDVNAAALAEQRHGAAQGCDPVLYITVGTGVGGGVVVNGAPVHGLLHPELGHLPMPRLDEDPFEGACPFHGRCLEGLCSGAALRARLGFPAEEAPPDHPVWSLTARYLGIGLASAVLMLSPQRIVVGGGVTEGPDLHPRIRQALRDALAGYIPRTEIGEGLDGYVVPPALDGRSGLVGAFELARAVAAANRP